MYYLPNDLLEHYSALFKLLFPLSGDIKQYISPSFFSINNYAGDREIEDKIISEVAGYGSQIGTLSDVLIDLIKVLDDERKDKPLKNYDSVKKFHDLVQKVHQQKKNSLSELKENIDNDLKQLQKIDKQAFKEILKKHLKQLEDEE